MKRLDRRHFLKGLTAGAGVASMFFNSPVARGQTTVAPVRVLLVPLTHGWGYDPSFGSDFTGSELDFTIPRPLQGFEAIKNQCVFVDGVRGTLWGNAHDVSYSDIFTAAVPWGEGSSDQLGEHFPEPMGPSLDYVIGSHHQRDVLRLSAGYGSWGFQHNPTCFDDNARLLSHYTTPRAAYDGIIAPIRDSVSPLPPGRRAMRNAFFDFLGRDTNRLLAKVSGTERLKLEGYLDALNNLGDRLNANIPVELTPGDIPPRPGIDLPFLDTIDQFFELITLAFRADTHRVAVLGLGEQLPTWSWIDESGKAQQGNIWVSDFHHNVAHYNPATHMTTNNRLAYEGWVQGYVQKIVQLANQLAAIEDIDGRTLLDNTIIVLTGEVSNGEHDTRRKTHILVGGGGGIRRGRWIRTAGVPPRSRGGFFIGGRTRDGTLVESTINYGGDFAAPATGDLLAAVGRLAGVPMDTFGFATNNTAPLQLT